MTDIDTRHFHGSISHDHTDGNLPHNHTPGDSKWQTGFPKGTVPAGKTSDNGASAAFSVGTMLIVVGALAMLFTSSNHSACSNVLVQVTGPQSCGEINEIWTLGVIGIAVGLILLIVGAILRSNAS